MDPIITGCPNIVTLKGENGIRCVTLKHSLHPEKYAFNVANEDILKR